ncbi:hypothetical protein CGK93_09375 [Arthrobacter sp. YN]|nr:hypothetical protein CGK93_09375 [Arthrobacter sp. YN]
MSASGSLWNWWRSRSANWRLVLLGGLLGTIGAVGLSALNNIGRFSVGYVPWILMNLFLFEIPAMVILGLVVSSGVIVALLPLPRSTHAIARALVAGIVATVGSGALIFLYFTLFPLTYNPVLAAAYTGPVVGIAFAIVVYRWGRGASKAAKTGSRRREEGG